MAVWKTLDTDVQPEEANVFLRDDGSIDHVSVLAGEAWYIVPWASYERGYSDDDPIWADPTWQEVDSGGELSFP